MAVRDFAIELIEELLKDNELALTEENIRFYDKGTTAETDENLDDHIRWRNARYYNEDSNVVRSSLLIVQLPVGQSAEYINFHVGELYRIYRRVGDMALVLYISLGNIDQGSINNILSAMVPRDTFQEWGLNENDVFDRTLANTMRLQPPVFCNITSGLGGQFQQKHVPLWMMKASPSTLTTRWPRPLPRSRRSTERLPRSIPACWNGCIRWSTGTSTWFLPVFLMSIFTQ